MLMQEQGTKMYIDALLKTHERIVQVGLTPQQTLYRHRKAGKEEALFQKHIILGLLHYGKNHNHDYFGQY